MKCLKLWMKASAIVATLGLSATASARDLILLLEATGSIGGTAYWLVSGTQATKAVFDFGQIAPGSGQDVNSSAVTLELKHPGAAAPNNRNIRLTRPSSCDIGGTSVNQADVALVFDGTETSTDVDVNFTFDTARSAQMRFKSNYGTLVGDVKCTGSGFLTYTY